MNTSEIAAAVEALLFVSDGPLARERLQGILEIDETSLSEALSVLADRYNRPESGIGIQEVGGGLSLSTKPGLAAFTERLLKTKPPALSQAALEVLAIIAYRQPVTRAEIDAIRGVKSDSALGTLLERNMVKELGRKPVLGRPLLYGTTREFLKHFGLNSVDELPEVRLPDDAEYAEGAGEQ